jgi:hypothetical protein
MLFEDGLTERVDLAEGDRSVPRSLESKRKAPDAAEQIQKSHVVWRAGITSAG